MKELFKEIKTIIWDWNGTLLDDTDICIHSMNHMLEKRQLPLLSHNRYKEVFTFPVKTYYTHIGFNFEKEPWDVAAIEFIDLYLEKLPQAQLARGARELLSFFRKHGFRQAIISAMQHEALHQSVESFGITHFFDYIGGIGDHYGGGKVDNARRFYHDQKLNPTETVLLGDTLHDAEVALELGSKCVLIANGHQSRERLVETGNMVTDDLERLLAEIQKDKN